MPLFLLRRLYYGLDGRPLEPGAQFAASFTEPVFKIRKKKPSSLDTGTAVLNLKTEPTAPPNYALRISRTGTAAAPGRAVVTDKRKEKLVNTRSVAEGEYCTTVGEPFCSTARRGGPVDDRPSADQKNLTCPRQRQGTPLHCPALLFPPAAAAAASI